MIFLFLNQPFTESVCCCQIVGMWACGHMDMVIDADMEHAILIVATHRSVEIIDKHHFGQDGPFRK